MKKRLFKKLNNAGNTLVIVLVVVAFMTVLGTVAVTSAMVGYKMKMVDKEVKRTFYSAEEVVDEIYSGLGMKTMKTLQGAYMNVLSNVTVSDTFEGDVYKKQVTNSEANAMLREKFTADLIKEFTGTVWQSKDSLDLTSGKEKFLEMINGTETVQGIIENPNLAKAVGVGSIEVVKRTSSGRDTYTLSFRNLTVEYRTNNELDAADTNTYFSRVTFDGVIDMDKYVNFATDTINTLREFEKFSIIGCLGVDVSEGVTANVNAGIYAGIASDAPSTLVQADRVAGGLTIKDSATLNVTGGDVKASIISKGRILLNSSIFKATNANVLCADLITSGDESNVDISGDTFVMDDTELNGDKNEVKFSGNYYGYGTGNATVIAGANLDSSAIIVNGSNSKVDLTGISTLLLAGRAYIDYTKVASSEADYQTGQSLALKGNQEVYLVPSQLMTEPGIESVIINGVPTDIPVTKQAYNSVAANKKVVWKYIENVNGVETVKEKAVYTPAGIPSNTVTIELNYKNFFGYNYLNQVMPFRFVNVSGRNYIYFNFASEEAVKAYYNAIFEEDARPEGLTTDEWNKYKLVKQAIKDILRNNIDDLNQSAILNVNDPNMKLLINGSLINATPRTTEEEAQIGNLTTATPDTLSLESRDMQTRYKLAYRTLLVQPLVKQGSRDYWDGIPEKVVVDEYLADLTGADSVSVNPFNYYVNEDGMAEYVSKGTTASEGKRIVENNGTLIAVITDTNGTYEVPTSATRGVVIAKKDVVINGNFSGIVFSERTVTVNGSANIDNSATTIILDNNKDLRECFKAYKTSDPAAGGTTGAAGTMLGLKYEDLITFENWRKQSPTTTSTVLPGGSEESSEASSEASVEPTVGE